MMPLNALLGSGGFAGGFSGGLPSGDPRTMLPSGTPAPYRPMPLGAPSPVANPDPRTQAPTGIPDPYRPVNFGSPTAPLGTPDPYRPMDAGGFPSRMMLPTSGPNPFGLAQPAGAPQARPGGWNFFGQPNYSLGALGGGF